MCLIEDVVLDCGNLMVWRRKPAKKEARNPQDEDYVMVEVGAGPASLSSATHHAGHHKGRLGNASTAPRTSSPWMSPPQVEVSSKVRRHPCTYAVPEKVAEETISRGVITEVYEHDPVTGNVS